MQPTSNQILRELAQDGNPAAIATLLNQIFASHAITVKISINQSVLKVVLLAEKMTDKGVILFLLKNEINKLSRTNFHTLKVNCHQKIKYFRNRKYREVTHYNVWKHEEYLR